MEEMKAEEEKEDETGTSLFHQLMAQRKDLEEDVVRIKLQTRGEEFKVLLSKMMIVLLLNSKRELMAYFLVML